MENEARKLITLGVQRYNESHAVDRLRSSIRVEDAERREALLALSETFEAELGMTLETTDREDMISIRGADPLMKETSQRILTKMLRGPVDAKVFLGLKKTISESMRRESYDCSQRSIEARREAVTGERRRLRSTALPSLVSPEPVAACRRGRIFIRDARLGA